MYLSPVYLSPTSFRQSLRRGTVAIFVAVCLIAMLAVIALSLDGGILLSERRHAQAVADAVAHSAATDVYLGNSTNTAQRSGLSTAAANGYTNDGETSLLTPNLLDADGQPLHGIWIPPISGDHIGDINSVEVAVQWNQPRSFSSIFGRGAIAVRARAVATATLAPSCNAGILVLDPAAPGALGLSGSASVQCNAPVIVDSSNPQAVTGSGASSVTAPAINITGNYTLSGAAKMNGTVNTGVAPTPDPLAALSPPDPLSLSVQSSVPFTLGSNNVATLSPGLYIGGISLSGSSSATLRPGIYYLKGGGLKLSGSSSLSGNGVLIYNEPVGSSDQVSLSGSGSVTLSPPTNGPYAGITLFQNRTSSVSATVSGSSDWNVSGTFYLAGARLTMSGSGGTAILGSQYISRDLTLSGHGSINVIWKARTVAGKASVHLVE